MTEHPSARLEDAVHQRVRLGILALLAEAPKTEFLAIRDALGLTNGNTSRHLTALEDSGYIQITKVFEGRRPKTLVTITPTGRKALEAEIRTLTELTDRFKAKTLGDAASLAATAAILAGAEQAASETPALRDLAALLIDQAPDGAPLVMQLGIDPERWRNQTPGAPTDPLLAPHTIYLRAWASADMGILAVVFAFKDAATARGFASRLSAVIAAHADHVASARIPALERVNVYRGPIKFTNVRTGAVLTGGAQVLFARGRHAFDFQVTKPTDVDAAQEIALRCARKQLDRLP